MTKIWWTCIARRNSTTWLHGGVFLGFLVFFMLLLLPIPLSGSILGTVDILFGPALSNTFLNRIQTILLGEFVGQSMYPADIARYGETGVGLASFFMVLKALGASDIYALYLVQATMLSLMAYATMLLAQEYGSSFPGAVLAGFAFSSSNYVWADIDNLPIHFYFWPLVSACFFKRAIRRKDAGALLTAGVAGGLQMYFSVQVYIYQTLMLGVLVMFALPELWRGFSTREKIRFAIPYVLIPLPLFLFYLNTPLNLGVVDPFPRTQWEHVYSLSAPDFLKVLPGKFLTYPFTSIGEGGWHRVAHAAFIGIAVPALALFGLKGFSKSKLELVTIAVLGIFFAMGTTIEVGGRHLTSPLTFFYQVVPLAKYLRVELRAYSLTILAISILAAVGCTQLARILGRWNRTLPAVGLALLFLLVGAENISWPLNAHETIPYPTIPEGYVEFFRDKPDALILDLPSHSTSWPGYIDEIIYVLWQTKHKRNILGGVIRVLPPDKDGSTVLYGSPAIDARFSPLSSTGCHSFRVA